MTRLQGIGWVMAVAGGVVAFIVLLGLALQALPHETHEDEGAGEN